MNCEALTDIDKRTKCTNTATCRVKLKCYCCDDEDYYTFCSNCVELLKNTIIGKNAKVEMFN